jgi:hypothetical protein
VPDTNKKDGQLNGRGMLWDVGVVVEDDVVIDEFHEAVEDEW